MAGGKWSEEAYQKLQMIPKFRMVLEDLELHVRDEASGLTDPTLITLVAKSSLFGWASIRALSELHEYLGVSGTEGREDDETGEAQKDS